MSVTAIRSALVTILETAGAVNVEPEELSGLDLRRALTERVSAGRTHFWIVRFARGPGEGGAGYIDRRHRVTIEGYIGVSRDRPADGTRSDQTVATLWDAIVAALESPSNAHPGGAIDHEAVEPEPIALQMVRVGKARVPVHRLRLTTAYLEA